MLFKGSIQNDEEEFEEELSDSSIEKFKFLAFKAFSENDYFSSHTFAEMFLSENPLDIDTNLINLNSLIKIEGKPIYQQEELKKRAIELVKFLRVNTENGNIIMQEHQKDKYRELITEYLKFLESKSSKDFNFY